MESPCACANLRRASRAATAAYDSALAPVGLRITQFAVLRTLARLGPLPVDRSTMGRNLDPLERRGLVRIGIGDRDLRERIAELTPQGEAAIAAALPYWRDAQARIAAVVDNEAIIRLADSLSALSHA
jgi:DNA-binding MarR family transcriptional regulator